MKKIICLIAVLMLLLCGCASSEPVKQTNLKSFSYEEDYAYFQSQSGVKYSGFVNVKKNSVDNAQEAIALAKKECTVDYNAITYAYDSKAKVYRVCFYTQDWIGGNQDVYISEDGITQFIAYGE